MKVLVTGVKGQLGFDCIIELKKKGHCPIGIDRDELDLTQEEEVYSFIRSIKPNCIIHCAAYTAVDKAEEDSDSCCKVNVEATKYLVNVSKELDIKLLYISTDYVFDGLKTGEYEINDLPNPKSVYGNTKYLGEGEAKKTDKHFIVRISWVFGINGNNFIKTMLRLSETRNELNVVSDQIGSPTYTKDLSALLVEMIESEKYGTYHVTNEGYCGWNDFARYIFLRANKDVEVNDILTKDYPTKAIRPQNSKLSKKSLDENGFKRLPSWEDAVDRYLEELKL